MINYSGLPQRVRRIVKQYEYCIERITCHHNKSVSIDLKSGYVSEGCTAINTADMEDLIGWLKKATKPASRVIKVALYGFKCPVCGRQVSKGSNYTDLGGMRICTMCG